MSTDNPDHPDAPPIQTPPPIQASAPVQASSPPDDAVTYKGDGGGAGKAVAAGVGAGTIGLVLGGCAVLVVCVCFCGVFGAIAIPNFVSMQYRAKRAEVPANVDGIKTAEIAYDAAFDTYVEVEQFQPDSSPGKEQRNWRAGTSFDTLGWGPDGKVRGSYRVLRRGRSDFVVQGIADVDGDGKESRFSATKSVNTMMTTGASTY